ncbi:MAG: hypothetical protein K9G62_04045 [Alphaproteobacteria bacterium]|nr:hypothetical protein [Alphaproteobacteria bacterium]
MIICLCHPFSDKKVRAHLENAAGRSTVSETYGACSDGKSPQCCTCLETLKDMVKTHNRGQAAA